MKRLFLLFLFSSSLIPHTFLAQERVLLHIDRNGQQEAIPLKKGERAQDVIHRLTGKWTQMNRRPECMDTRDTIKYFPTVAALTSNFGFVHQDVALQWYISQSNGEVEEVWWYNHQKTGTTHKATIRGWYINPKVMTRPVSEQTKYLGTYKDPLDGDGNVTPFRPQSGDQWFYGNGASDSSTWNFDPLSMEAPKWLPGGVQVILNPEMWQGITLKDWGDSMKVSAYQPFGFTLSNDTKKSEIAVGDTDQRMEVLSMLNTNAGPYHSYKFYENGRTGPVDKGWHLRGDYEWGMFVVVYSPCVPPTRMFTNSYGTTLKTTPRIISVTVTDDNPGGGPSGIASVLLFTKKGVLAPYDSAAMIKAGSTYTGTAPGGVPGDTVFWYIVATDVNGNRTKTSTYSYKIFKQSNVRLLIYNNAQYNLLTANLIYTASISNISTKYDLWSGPSDGTGELADLLALYDNVVIADGSFPSRNVYPALSAWLKQASASTQRNLFFTSQDYGCYITPACGDTTFAAGTFENLLGIATLGPQDQGSANRPVRIVPQADPITNYLLKYSADSSVTLWHYPTYELAFSAYPDFLTKTANAKSLFADESGNYNMGIRNDAEGLHTMFLGFDAGALQFRSDTSLHNAGYTTVTDPHYAWITDVKPLANAFFDAVTGVDDNDNASPNFFGLEQNYPNPFNPTTTIRYSLGARSSVSLTIYNTLGQSVATLINTTQDAGPHSVEFNATRLASGLYFYRLQAGAFTSVKKMIVVK